MNKRITYKEFHKFSESEQTKVVKSMDMGLEEFKNLSRFKQRKGLRGCRYVNEKERDRKEHLNDRGFRLSSNSPQHTAKGLVGTGIKRAHKFR